MYVNGFGATATAVTTLVVLIAKFTEGAWITLLLIPGLMLLMRSVKRHYDRVAKEIETEAPIHVTDLRPPLVVLPIDRWDAVSEKALQFAWTISREIRAVHVECGEETDRLREQWGPLVEAPAGHAGLPVPSLVVLKSPFRFVVRPIAEYVLRLEQEQQTRNVAVLVPHLIESRWFYRLLHNNRSTVLKALLLIKGNQRTAVVDIPWHLHD